MFECTLGGLNCDVQYAGLAPGFVGVYQVNFLVPAGTRNGSDLVVTANSVASPPVKVEVR